MGRPAGDQREGEVGRDMNHRREAGFSHQLIGGAKHGPQLAGDRVGDRAARPWLERDEPGEGNEGSVPRRGKLRAARGR
jgi:hypothetical protein